MIKEIHYCDYCGKLIDKPVLIKTRWDLIKSFFFPFVSNEITSIEGDGCRECYNSYKLWAKSRSLK